MPNELRMHFPRGGTLPTQIKNTAYGIVVAGEAHTAANAAMVREGIRVAEQLESKYPSVLRISERLPRGVLNGDGFSIMHNSPHYGNTDLRRIADVFSTAMALGCRDFTTADVGLPMIELRTTVDTSNMQDCIYEPHRLIGVHGRVTVGEPSGTKLIAMATNPVTEQVAAGLSSGIETLENPLAKELLASALVVIPKLKTYVEALRLWNTAVRCAFLAEAGLAVQDYVIDVPDSMWSRTDIVNGEIAKGNGKLAAFLETIESNGHSGELKTFARREGEKLSINMLSLTGAVHAILMLRPTLIKGGRSMHNYFPHTITILGIPVEQVPTYMQMPELGVGTFHGIPTLAGATDFAKAHRSGIEEQLRGALSKRRTV